GDAGIGGRHVAPLLRHPSSAAAPYSFYSGGKVRPHLMKYQHFIPFVAVLPHPPSPRIPPWPAGPPCLSASRDACAARLSPSPALSRRGADDLPTIEFPCRRWWRDRQPHR